MNIAIISYYFNDHHAEGIVTAKLARGLSEAGHTVTVFGNLIGNQKIVNKNSNNLDYFKIINNTPSWWKFLKKMNLPIVLRKKILAIPSLITYNSSDDYGWVIETKKAILKEHRKRPFDIIHSRLNPHSSHQVALLLKRTNPKIPWCAYFSDPWPPHRLPAPYENSSGTLSRWRSDRIMRSFLKSSDSIVFTSTYMRDYIIKGYERQLMDKSFLAPHLSTYWESPIDHIYEKTLTFRHSGIINKNRNPNVLFDSIRKYLEKNKTAFEFLRFEFLGRNHAGYKGKPLKPPHDLRKIVSFIEQKDLEATWKWISEADILLLLEFQFSQGIFFYAKLSDYLHANRPILALSPNKGVVADLFKNGGGIIVPPHDSNEIAKALDRLITAWQSQNLHVSLNSSLSKYVKPANIIPIYEKAFEFAIRK